MAKQNIYRQCQMTRKSEGGIQLQTSWLPDKFAGKGKALRLDIGDHQWEEGWVVKEVGKRGLPEETVLRNFTDYRNHRKNDMSTKERARRQNESST